MRYTKQIVWEDYDTNNLIATIDGKKILKDKDKGDFFYMTDVGDIFKMPPEEIEKLAGNDLIKEVEDENEEKKLPRKNKVLVKNFGNIVCTIKERNEHGIIVISSRDEIEEIEIPWNSIILITDKLKP